MLSTNELYTKYRRESVVGSWSCVGGSRRSNFYTPLSIGFIFPSLILIRIKSLFKIISLNGGQPPVCTTTLSTAIPPLPLFLLPSITSSVISVAGLKDSQNMFLFHK
ncbi:hypothetical protein EB796_004170 [Bugula neritina]|uniref:Uncharacterized protein n=1 Tax=Bugula neritina TaxID=10212 RepID=A0A7J7KH23_BUGNE|nr:hypothetical protein EB796_004170 [Bugula neritina]